MTALDQRIYAIGDVQGRLDLLEDLIGRIREDNAARGPVSTTIVQIGNLIGDGPDSAALLCKFKNFTALSPQVVVLKGRNEAMMAESLAGNLMMFGLWLQLGGDAALASWGVDHAVIAERHLPKLQHVALEVIPREMLEWLSGLPLSYRSGDYLFGQIDARMDTMRGGRLEDLFWIDNDVIKRENSRRASIVQLGGMPGGGPRDSGIAPGTGRSRRLIALGLEGSQRWIVQSGSNREAVPGAWSAPIAQATAGARR